MENTENENFITDEQLLILLDKKEAGKSFPEAIAQLNTVPLTQEDTEKLHQIWKMHTSLMSESHAISPEVTLLSKILDATPVNVDENVTNPVDIGYNEHSVENEFINTRNIDTFMQINWKYAAPITVLVVIVAATLTMGNKEEPSSLAVNNVPAEGTHDGAMMAMEKTSPEGGAMMAMEKTSPEGGAMMAMEKTSAAAPVKVAATGDADALVTSLLAEADGDKTLLDDASADISLVTADSQSITDFNTTYNETTF